MEEKEKDTVVMELYPYTIEGITVNYQQRYDEMVSQFGKENVQDVNQDDKHLLFIREDYQKVINYILSSGNYYSYKIINPSKAIDYLQMQVRTLLVMYSEVLNDAEKEKRLNNLVTKLLQQNEN